MCQLICVLVFASLEVLVDVNDKVVVQVGLHMTGCKVVDQMPLAVNVQVVAHPALVHQPLDIVLLAVLLDPGGVDFPQVGLQVVMLPGLVVAADLAVVVERVRPLLERFFQQSVSHGCLLGMARLQ